MYYLIIMRLQQRRAMNPQLLVQAQLQCSSLLLFAKQIGAKMNIEVLRNDKLISVSSKVYEKEGRKLLGISLTNVYEVSTDPEVEIKIKSNESGPSGGLMMALSVYNSLVKEDISKGKKIIGTGTIDIDGNVGEIGGVKYKLIGAVKNKSDIFLCQSNNYC